MRFVVIIPTYKGHLLYIPRVLDSIQAQTRLPEVVIVCASSCPSEWKDTIDSTKYSFELQIYTTEEKQNAAQNRNRGIDALDSFDNTIVSFFDSDDVMHPRRLECIEHAFQEEPTDVVLHGHTVAHIDDSVKPEDWKLLETVQSHRNCVEFSRMIISHPLIPDLVSVYGIKSSDPTLTYNNGACSVKGTILEIIRFDPDATYYEDTTFTGDIFKYGYSNYVILDASLMKYSQLTYEELNKKLIEFILSSFQS